jgi:hypothetical protein
VDICLLSLIRMWWTNMQTMLVCIRWSEGPIPGVRQVVVDDDRTAIQGRQRQREAILVKRICVFSLYPF